MTSFVELHGRRMTPGQKEMVERASVYVLENKLQKGKYAAEYRVDCLGREVRFEYVDRGDDDTFVYKLFSDEWTIQIVRNTREWPSDRNKIEWGKSIHAALVQGDYDACCRDLILLGMLAS